MSDWFFTDRRLMDARGGHLKEDRVEGRGKRTQRLNKLIRKVLVRMGRLVVVLYPACGCWLHHFLEAWL